MKNAIRLTLAATLAALLTSAHAAPVAYTLDPDHTIPRFEVMHNFFSNHTGAFMKSAGKAVLDTEASQDKRAERDDRGPGDDQDGRERAAVRLGVLRRAPGDEPDAGDQQPNADQRGAVDVLAEVAHGDEEQQHETGREGRLHDGERRVRECDELRPDADDSERGTKEPHGPSQQMAEEADLQAE